MEHTNINIYGKSDLQYIKEIGNFVRASRIEQNKTQDQLATEAGVNRATVSQLEKGQSVNLLSLIHLLRALKLLDVFLRMDTKPQISPLQAAALEQKTRKRAGRNTLKSNRPLTDW